MTPKDFVYTQIYKGALSRSASELFAHQRAVMGTEAYLKNSFKGKAIALIESEIKEAVKMSKMIKRKKK